MALATSRLSWKQIHRSWICRADVSRCLHAVDRHREWQGAGTSSRHAATAALSLRIYSSEECPLCDGLKEKLDALRERAKFQLDIWANMQVEVRSIIGTAVVTGAPAGCRGHEIVQAIDVDQDQHLKDKYRMRIPVLEVEAAGGEWKELPFQSPRLTADALGKRLEKHISEVIQ
jgi:hypothetical protein